MCGNFILIFNISSGIFMTNVLVHTIFTEPINDKKSRIKDDHSDIFFLIPKNKSWSINLFVIVRFRLNLNSWCCIESWHGWLSLYYFHIPWKIKVSDVSNGKLQIQNFPPSDNTFSPSMWSNIRKINGWHNIYNKNLLLTILIS